MINHNSVTVPPLIQEQARAKKTSVGKTSVHKLGRRKHLQNILSIMLLWALCLGPIAASRPSQASPLAVSPAASQASTQATIEIYTDALDGQWQNWSWGTTIDFSQSSTVQSGTAALSATYTDGYVGLFLHSTVNIDSSTVDKISFGLHGGSAGGQSINVVAVDQNGTWGPGYTLTAAANQWQTVELTPAQLGSPAAISAIVFQSNSATPQPTFYLDNIQVTTQGQSSNATLTVDLNGPRHPISDHIYGVNFADQTWSEAERAALGISVNRWGGNGVSRYNYQDDISSAGSDWYYVNSRDNNPGTGYENFVSTNRNSGTETLLTMPMLGWVAKDPNADNCGFPTSVYGSQQSTINWGSVECGNGNDTNGNPISPDLNRAGDYNQQIDENFVAGWINTLVNSYGNAANGGVKYYSLDNEPMLWSHTHRDLHPNPASYDEVRDLAIRYGSAIKQADPTSLVTGPALWGWQAYNYSDLDNSTNNADRNAHGGKAFAPWYLEQMQNHEQSTGTRILDYLDLHYYPQNYVGADFHNIALRAAAGDAAEQATRLRAVRSLWDTTYTDETWINTQIALIPRAKGWIAGNYPGTKLAITEYNFGGYGEVNGVLAQAEVLGIFGREQVDMATMWKGNDQTASQPWVHAFGIFRNYDGNGARFGDESISASSTSHEQLSIYAARRTNDGAITVMVINKSGTDLNRGVAINGSAAATAQVWRYNHQGNANAITRIVDQAISNGEFTTNFPANTITLFVLGDSGDPVPTNTPTPTPTNTAIPTPTNTPVDPPTPTNTPAPTKTPVPQPTATTQPAGAFFESFDGDPTSPTAWNPDNWDVAVHSRDRQTLYQLEPMQAAHGPNCEPPPASHTVTDYADAVFQCKNHMMTAISAEGYGAIYVAPDHMVDFSTGEAVIRFDISTERTSSRDWWDIWVTPYEHNLQLPLESWLPDLQGPPMQAVHIRMDQDNKFYAELFDNHNDTRLFPQDYRTYDDLPGFVPSPKTRSTFELRISQGHLKFGMPDHNLWWIDTDIPNLTWNSGVVQLGHHSYNPTKCDSGNNCPLPQQPNTWHWDNVEIDPSQPFTMIGADRRYIEDATGSTIVFDAPAPANAHARFSALGENLEVSFNNGATWELANRQPQVRDVLEHATSYFTPIPQGISSMMIRGDNWYENGWIAKDFAIWATGSSSATSELTYVSSTSGGNVGGVGFSDEDIMVYDSSDGSWARYFDGSDVGLNSSWGLDVNAFAKMDDGSILLSFTGPGTISDVGAVDDSDIIRFVPTSLGNSTSGTFEIYLDGSDVGLTTNGEDIDGISIMPNGHIAISTLGSARVSDSAGANLVVRDEDIAIFVPTSLGANTSGYFTKHFVGANASLNTSNTEDVNGIYIDSSGTVNMTTIGAFDVPGLSGIASDIFSCDLTGTGNSTSCASITKRFDGTTTGFSSEVMDGIHIESATLTADPFFSLTRNLNEPLDNRVDPSELEDMIDDVDDNLEAFPEENNSTSSLVPSLYLPMVVDGQ